MRSNPGGLKRQPAKNSITDTLCGFAARAAIEQFECPLLQLGNYRLSAQS